MFFKVIKLISLSLLGLIVIMLIYFSNSEYYLSNYYNYKIKIISLIHGENKQNKSYHEPAATISALKPEIDTAKNKVPKKNKVNYEYVNENSKGHHRQPQTDHKNYNNKDNNVVVVPKVILNVRFFPNVALEESFRSDKIVEESNFSFYRLGEVVGDNYNGGILYKIKIVDEGKGNPLYRLIRCLKVDSQVILLSQCSSPDCYDPRKYLSNSFDHLESTEFFQECFANISERLVTKDNIIIEELAIPDTITTPELSLNLYFREVRCVDPGNFDSSILQLAFVHPQLGNVYTTREDLNGNGFMDYYNWLEGICEICDDDFLLKNGFYIIQQDSSVLVYAFDFDEVSFDFTDSYDYVGAKYRDCSGSYSDYGCVVPKNALDFKNDLIQIGMANIHDSVYIFADKQHRVLKKIYADLQRNHQDYSKLLKGLYYGRDSLPDYDTFINLCPIFFWKDGLGRYIRFISSLCTPPVGCEPIIYIYSPEPGNFTLTFDEKVKVFKSIPEYSDTWHVKTIDNGEIIDCRTGKKHSYLFWEGMSDLLPPLRTGFVVRKDEIEIFFHRILPRLGLNSRETRDFIKAWLPEFKEAPFYFIGFYDQEIIEYYAPLSVIPQPQTVIRVLMDYRALDKEIKVTSPKLKKIPKRDGITLVEWGGLKRSFRSVTRTE